MKKYLIIISLLCLYVYSYSKDEMATANFYNLKNMSMGNSTFTTDATDMALFTNPASMALISEGKFTILGVSSGINDKGSDMSSTIIDIATEDKNFATDAEALDYLKKKQAEVKGKTFSGFTNANAVSYTGKNFGFGIYSNMVITNFEITSDVSPKIILKGEEKFEIPFGMSFSVGKTKHLHLGASLRYINIAQFDATGDNAITATKLMNNSTGSDLINGSLDHGFGLNIGSAYTFPNGNTNIGLGLQNAWSSIEKYKLTDSISASDILSGGSDKIGTYKLMPNLRLGVTTKPLKWVEVTGEIDNLLSKNIDGIDDTDDKDIYKKIHFGTELSPLKFTPRLNKIMDLRLRLGSNQGYFTYGAGVSLLFLNFEYAHFTEEASYRVGMDPNPIDAYSLFVRF